MRILSSAARRGRAGGGGRGWLPALALCLLFGCSRPPGDAASEPSGDDLDGGSELASPGSARAVASWLYLSASDFHHRNGASGDYYLPEIMGAGGALLDYDGDGDLDLYVVQSGSVDGRVNGGDRLYRTDAGASSEGRRVDWVDVTRTAGIEADGYGMGVAVGDIDNDGRPDLYVTNAGPNQLWRNRGDGTFEDVTERAGVGEDRWSTSASFFDYDGDGWLDLYVANYVDFRPSTHHACRSVGGVLDYCGPQSYDPEPDRLFHNRGDGTFEDVSGPSGIAERAGNGLGVIAADFDGDGRTDLFVVNDRMENFLWRNVGDGTFVEEAARAGCSVDGAGGEAASTGAAAADFDEDGALDLFMTYRDGETGTLCRGDGGGAFTERTAPARPAAPSVASPPVVAPSSAGTAFGIAVTDLDLDGWQDLYVANGAVHALERLRLEGDPFPFRQADRIVLNTGGDGFVGIDESALTRGRGHRSEVGRGVAAGDRLRAGFRLLVVFDNGGPAHLVDAVASSGAGWLGVDALTATGRAAVGTEVTAQLVSGRTLHRRVHRDGSYCSSSDPTVLLGLGEDREVSVLRFDWPGGAASLLRSPPVGRYLRIVEPSGGVER